MAQNFLSDIKLGDNIYIRLGDATNGDLQIYHTGSISKIIEAGSTELQISSGGSNLYLQAVTGENAIKVIPNNSVELYYDNSKKFETTSAGIKLPSYGAGYLKTDANGNVSVDTSTIEDTLQTVTDRGSTTTNNITLDDNTTESPYVGYIDNSGANSSDIEYRTYSTNGNFLITRTGNGGADIMLSGHATDHTSSTTTFAGDVTVGGDLIVSGDTVTLSTQTVEVEDNIIVLNKTQSDGSATASTSGIAINRGGSTAQASFIFDDGDDYWDLTHNLAVQAHVVPSTNAGGSLGLGNKQWNGLHLANSSSITWTNGDAKITEGEVGGYSLSFDIYNGSTALERVLLLEKTKKATFSGDVAVEGGILYLGKADTASGHINSKELMTFNIDTDNDDTNRYFGFYTNGESGSGSELVRIQEDGKVGIGTTSPLVRLSLGSGVGQKLNVFESGNTRIGLGADIGTSHYGLSLYTNQSITFGKISTSDGSTFTETMRIDSSGNVGIGTNSPTNSTNYNTLDIRGTSGGQIILGRTAMDFFLYSTSTSSHLGSAAGQALVFHTNSNGGNNERMRLDTSGNLLVGKTSNDISVAGAKIGGSTGSNFTRDSAEVVYVNRTTNDGKAITIAKDGATVGVIGTQNWGIGTSSPDGNLEVIASTVVSGASDTVNNVLIGLQSANRPTIILDTADTTYTNRTWNITNVGSIGSLAIGRNGLDVMTMKNDGSVGIGTDSPDSLLHIESTANTSTPIFTIENDNAIKMTLGVVRSAAGTSPDTSFIAYDGSLRFIPGSGSATEKLTLDSSGNATFAGNVTVSKDGYQLRLKRADGADDDWRFYSWASGLNIYSQTASTIFFGRDGQTADVNVWNGDFTVTSGKIHVGSGAPNGFIDVHADNGNWRVNSYGAMYFRNSSNATHESYIHSRSDGSLSIGRVAESNWTGSGAGAYAATTYDHVKFDTSSNATFEGNIIGKGYLNLSNGYGSTKGLYLNGNPAVWREDNDNLRLPLPVARFNEIVTVGNQNGNNNGSGPDGRYATGVLDLSHSGTPSNYRIETNIPFNSGGADFTIHIEGFRYGGRDPVSLIICWHIYPANTPYNHCVISNGGWSPVVKIARNTANNLTTLFIESPGYWPKMYVRSIHSSNYEIGAYAKGWTWSDATLASGYDVITTVPYQPLSLGSGGINNAGAINATSGTFSGTVTADPGVAGTKAIKAVGTYASNDDVKLLEFVRTGDAVAGAIEYNDATTDMEIGTVTNHAFSIKTNDTRRLTFANSGAASFTGNITTSGYVGLNATSTLFFDANTHGHTLIKEISDDRLGVTVGGTLLLDLYEGSPDYIHMHAATTIHATSYDASNSNGNGADEFLAEFKGGTNNVFNQRYVKLTQTFTGSAKPSPLIVFEANHDSDNHKSYVTLGSTSDGEFYVRQGEDKTAVAAGSDLAAQTVETFRITPAGNATFAGTIASKTLTITPAGEMSQRWNYYTSGGNDYSLEHHSGGMYIYNRTTSTAVWSWSNTGYFGIGTDVTPSAALDVKGTTNLASRFIFTKDLSTDKILFGGADHDNFDTFVGSSSNHSFTITQNGAAAITIDTSKNATFADGVKVDNGDLILGEDAFSVSADYVGMKTSHQSGTNDYMIISGTSDGSTYVSSKSGSATYIRAGGNHNTHQLAISSTGAVFSGDLQVNGNLNIVGNSSVVNVEDINVEQNEITLNYNASSDTSSSADGAGIRIQDAVDASNDATISWNATSDEFEFSHPIKVAGVDYKIATFGTDNHHQYRMTGNADHTLTLTCGSYYQAEIIITAHQTNGGANNNLYIRGIWSNNHESHHWDAMESIGGLTGSSFDITVSANTTSNSGKLLIEHDYVSGTFAGLEVRVKEYFGTHAYTIS